MTDKKQHPYVKFYGRDWLGDSSLRMCDPAERGVWIDLLCVMMAGDPYGHLAINKRPMTDSEVSRIIGLDEKTYKGILYRLIEKGIPSKTEEGMIFSRRLVREHQRFVTGSVSGKKGGGNPALRHHEEKKENTDIRSHIPEAKGGLKVSFIGQDDSGIVFSLEDCLKAAVTIGMKKESVEEFFHRYNRQGWVFDNGKPIRNLASALATWKSNQPSRGKSYREPARAEPERRYTSL